MTDKLHKDIHRGQRARNILGDELFSEAKEHIESELFRLFKTVTPTDVEALQQIKGMQYMHDKYVAFLNAAVNDGKLAQIEVERQSKLKKFARKLVG